jgi:hypothetical protein
MATETSVSDFIATQGLAFAYQPAPENPHMEDDTGRMSHYACTIRNGKAKMVVYFSKGEGHRRWKKTARGPEVKPGQRAPMQFTKTLWFEENTEPEPPTLGEVLDCLASDAASVDNARSFEDWASDFGYDTDSRKAKRTYKTCEKQAAKLKALLGDEAYEQLLYHTERL